MSLTAVGGRERRPEREDTGVVGRTTGSTGELAERRAALLHEFAVLGVTGDPEVDGVVRVAAAVTGMPYAAIDLLDGGVRPLSPHGVVDPLSPPESPLSAVVAEEAPGVHAIADLTLDPRFAGNPWVDGRRGRLRAYAGAHLVVDDVTVGTLSVLDDRPHPLDRDTCDRLADLAEVVVGVFRRRRQARELAELARARELARREIEAAHAELARSEAFTRALLESLPVGVVAADAQGRLSLFNGVSRDWHGLGPLSGLPPEEWPSVFSLTDATGRPLEPHEVPLTRAYTEGRITDVEMRISRPDAPARLLTISGCQVRGEDGQLLGAVIAMADVTARRELEEALRAAALHDPLTGLPNRSLLVDRLEQSLQGARRTGSPVAVLFCDLDGFKQVNDVAGHAAGDEVLVSAVRRLQGAVRPGDTVARLGGDEFVVLCPGVTTAEAAQVLADRVAAAFGAPLHEASGTEHQVGVSVGIALATAEDTPESALAAADAEMYRVKEARRSATRWPGLVSPRRP
jgi:diguanylate cyclase (GGDEF)-like protein